MGCCWKPDVTFDEGNCATNCRWTHQVEVEISGVTRNIKPACTIDQSFIDEINAIHILTRTIINGAVTCFFRKYLPYTHSGDPACDMDGDWSLILGVGSHLNFSLGDNNNSQEASDTIGPGLACQDSYGSFVMDAGFGSKFTNWSDSTVIVTRL